MTPSQVPPPRSYDGEVAAVYLIMAAVAANRFEMYQVPSWACLPLVH
jgi:hypothetical protein